MCVSWRFAAVCGRAFQSPGVSGSALRRSWGHGVQLLPWAARLPPRSGVAVLSRSATSASLVRSSFHESQEQVALTERQEAFVLERFPADFDEEELHSRLRDAGIDLGEAWRDRIFIMRSRLGVSLGRALIAYSEPVPHVRQAMPPGTAYRPMDRNDIETFVEQAERFVCLSDDLRRIARPEHFLRVITITEVPPTYGRKDMVHVIREHCGVTVNPTDVVFRFKRWGRQSDTCYVICPSQQEADHCVAQIQELAVPKRAAYGALFGCTFLWSSRASLFLSHVDLDFLLAHGPKSWVFTTGWQGDLATDEFLKIMYQLGFFPMSAVRHGIVADGSSAFFLLFDSMENVKKAFTRFRRLRWRWRMKREIPFFAYPRCIDVHRADEDRYEDEDSGADSDIEEPVHY